MGYEWDMEDKFSMDDVGRYQETIDPEPEISGFDSEYYELPVGATELQDLIEYKEMNFAVGNIFKACYRLGSTKSIIYDIEKILWFAERELKRLTPEGDNIKIPEDATEEDVPSIAEQIVQKANDMIDAQKEKAYLPFGIWRDKGQRENLHHEDKKEH